MMLPEPLALMLTAPVPDSVPVTLTLPLFNVLMLVVPVVTAPDTVVPAPEVVVRLPALTVPPRFIVEPDVIPAVVVAVTAPVVSSVVPALAVRL